jgi:parallel beta-helix repeat protein
MSLFFIIILNICQFSFAINPNFFQKEPILISKQKSEESVIYSEREEYLNNNLSHCYIQKEISPTTQKSNLLKTSIRSSTSIPHDPIIIESNADFSGFPGTGTINDPFRIENFNVSGFDATLISVANTNVHFRIKNNFLNGLNTNPFCINLLNVSNCVIEDNIVLNSMNVGIILENASNNLIINNTVSGHGEGGVWILHFSNDNQIINNTISDNDIGDGINIDNSQENLIFNNVVCRNRGSGISVWPSNKSILFHPINNQVINNTVYDNNYYGINLEYGKNNLISNNIIYDNNQGGLLVEQSSNSTIKGNFVYKHESNSAIHNGIHLLNSNNNMIINNSISDLLSRGIMLQESSNNTISSNNFVNNEGMAVHLRQFTNCWYNKVSWNNFMGNGDPNLQAMDFGINSTVEYNYWDEWTSPDRDFDGIVDNSYIVSPTNQDNFPLTSIHILSSITISNPADGENLNDSVTIDWTAATDSHDHDITYSIYYSRDGGITWITVASGLVTTSYNWNSSRVQEFSFSGAIKIEAICSEGLLAETITENIFLQTKYSAPSIIFPNGGEIIHGITTIRWSAVTGVEGDDIVYSLLYSSTEGNSWDVLSSNITITSYVWNTSNTEDGSNYLIKVIASCSSLLSAEDTSDDIFTIDNTPFQLGNLEFVPILLVFCSTIAIGYFIVTKKMKTPSFTEFFQSDQVEFFRPLYNKVVIGLENIKNSMISEFVATPLLEPLEAIEQLDPVDTSSLTNYFPTDFQETLKSMKGRTALVLIEMAYQDLLETNPTKISQSLNIPPTTVSDEIKRLITLDFIESDVQPSLIQDARFKYYKITSKGFIFLSSLKRALELSINRLRRKGTEDWA